MQWTILVSGDCCMSQPVESTPDYFPFGTHAADFGVSECIALYPENWWLQTCLSENPWKGRVWLVVLKNNDFILFSNDH